MKKKNKLTILYSDGTRHTISNIRDHYTKFNLYTQYTNGDQIWSRVENSKETVYKIKTYDGIRYSEFLGLITKRDLYKTLIPLSLLILIMLGLVIKSYLFGL